MSIIVFNTILYGSIFKLFLEHMYWLKIQNCWLCTLKWWVCVSCHSVAKGSSKFRPILDLNHVNLSHYYNFLLVYRFMGLLCFRINLHPSELPASPTGYVRGGPQICSDAVIGDTLSQSPSRRYDTFESVRVPASYVLWTKQHSSHHRAQFLR